MQGGARKPPYGTGMLFPPHSTRAIISQMNRSALTSNANVFESKICSSVKARPYYLRQLLLVIRYVLREPMRPSYVCIHWHPRT